MASVFKCQRLLAVERLCDETFRQVENLVEQHRIDTVLCAFNHITGDHSLPLVPLSLPRTQPEELDFSTAVSRLVMQSKAEFLLLCGDNLADYCTQRLKAVGLLSLELKTLKPVREPLYISTIEQGIRSVSVPPAEEAAKKQLLPHRDITVAISHFNRSVEVFDAIRSVLAQSKIIKTLLIVDDCSEDEHWLCLQQGVDSLTAECQITLLRNEKNIGLGATRNHALEACQTDYILFLDDDDMLHPRAVEYLSLAVSEQNVDVITMAFYRSVEQPEQDEHCFFGEQGKVIYYTGDAGTYFSLHQDNAGGATALMSTSALRTVSGFHEYRDCGADDWELYIRLMGAGFRLFHLPLALMWYRASENSMSSQVAQRFRMRRDDLVAQSLSAAAVPPSPEELRYLQNYSQQTIAQLPYVDQALKTILLIEDELENITLYCANVIALVLLKHIRYTYKRTIKQIIDKDVAKQRGHILGVPVRSPENLQKSDRVLICSDSYAAEIEAELRQQGVSHIHYWRC